MPVVPKVYTRIIERALGVTAPVPAITFAVTGWAGGGSIDVPNIFMGMTAERDAVETLKKGSLLDATLSALAYGAGQVYAFRIGADGIPKAVWNIEYKPTPELCMTAEAKFIGEYWNNFSFEFKDPGDTSTGMWTIKIIDNNKKPEEVYIGRILGTQTIEELKDLLNTMQEDFTFKLAEGVDGTQRIADTRYFRATLATSSSDKIATLNSAVYAKALQLMKNYKEINWVVFSDSEVLTPEEIKSLYHRGIKTHQPHLLALG